MKRALLILSSALLFSSCSSDNKAEKKEVAAEPQVKSAVKIDPREQQLEIMKNASTTGLDELQKMLPASLAEIKRSKFSMTSNLGYATAQADYEKNSKTYIHLVLYDCAGAQGADLYNKSFLSDLDKSIDNEAGYTKTIALGSGKAIEKYEAATKVTTISFLANDKILFVLAGKNIPAETLKDAIHNMNVKIS